MNDSELINFFSLFYSVIIILWEGCQSEIFKLSAIQSSHIITKLSIPFLCHVRIDESSVSIFFSSVSGLWSSGVVKNVNITFQVWDWSLETILVFGWPIWSFNVFWDGMITTRMQEGSIRNLPHLCYFHLLRL